jgi:two-component system response regulator RegX3
MARLLLVDDDPHLLHALCKLFQRAGYYCATASSAAEVRGSFLRAGSEPAYDLLLLDVGLPDGDGFSLCRQLRARHHLPILMLTARCDPADRVVGLELGADDYLPKPFDPAELLARVRALLRRASEYNREPERSQRYAAGPLVVDAEAHTVCLDGCPVSLTEREFALLLLLARHQGKALASGWIFETLWGCDADLGLKTLTVHVQRLRQKIEPDPRNPRLVLTVRGFGYKLCGHVEHTGG